MFFKKYFFSNLFEISYSIFREVFIGKSRYSKNDFLLKNNCYLITSEQTGALFLKKYLIALHKYI